MRALNSMVYVVLAGILACSAYGALEAVPNHERTRQDQRPLARDIEARLKNDPLFQGAHISIDLYGDLVMVHGSAANESMISAVNGILRRTPCVGVIFNYMISPDRPDTSSALSVTYDSFDRLADINARNSSYVVAQRVKDRFRAEQRLAGYDLTVDTYQGLIILHGRVNSVPQANLARDIAAYTDGVVHVISFVDIAGEPLLAPVSAAPVFHRSTAIGPFEPQPVIYEREECVRECR